MESLAYICGVYVGLKTVRINPVMFRSDFYILPVVFVFSDKFGIGTKSGYPVFTNSVYTIFITMCVAVAMNLLNLLYECGLVSCYYILHYYVSGCELVCKLRL